MRACTIILILKLALIYGLPCFAQHGEKLKAQLDLVSQELRLRPDSAYLQLKTIYEHAKEHDAYAVAADALQAMGEIAFHLGNYPQSLADYHKSLQLYKNTGDRKKEAELLDDIGILYYYNQQPAKAFVTYRAAMKIYQSLQDKDGIADTNGKLGHLYEKQGQYDSAFYYQHAALALYQQTDNKNGLAKIHENLGSIYEDKADYKKATEHFVFALELYAQTDNKLQKIEVLNNIGDMHRKTGAYQQALVETRKALQLAEQLNELYQMESAYRDIGKAHNLLGNNDSAFLYLEKSREFARKLYSRENSLQISFFQVLYDMEEKEDEILRLNNVRKISMTVLLAIFLVAFVMYRSQRSKIKNERKLRKIDKDLLETQNKLIKVELENKALSEQSLKKELELKRQELTSNTLYVIQKNQFLESLKKELAALISDDKRDNRRSLKRILSQINQSFNNDKYWEDFRVAAEKVHGDFYARLKEHSPDLKASDLRLVALLKMNFSTEEIASLLGISIDSARVARYRLRKKLNLEQQENLTTFLQNL